MSRGIFISDAPHGVGLLITGGYTSNKLQQVQAAHERDKNGRRVAGANHVERKLGGDFLYDDPNCPIGYLDDDEETERYPMGESYEPRFMPERAKEAQFDDPDRIAKEWGYD